MTVVRDRKIKTLLRTNIRLQYFSPCPLDYTDYQLYIFFINCIYCIVLIVYIVLARTCFNERFFLLNVAWLNKVLLLLLLLLKKKQLYFTYVYYEKMKSYLKYAISLITCTIKLNHKF